MSDVGSELQVVLLLMGASFLLCHALWGIQPMLRRRAVRKIRRQERVRFSSDVNTELAGYKIDRNHWHWLVWTVFFAGWSALTAGGNGVLFAFGCSVYFFMIGRRLHLARPFQMMQSYLLTDQGVWLFPERMGRPLGRGEWKKTVRWEEVTAYRVDGSYLQFYQFEKLVLQVEFEFADYEELLRLLVERNVRRSELSDRIWVAQFDEEEFYALEESICSTAWGLLGLFDDEMEALGVMPEFGVMRNMPGDRLLDEHARSWLQLNLLDPDTSERKLSSMFPLWQSNGSVGYLIGARGQELVDRLQQWMRKVLAEAAGEKEEMVS